MILLFDRREGTSGHSSVKKVDAIALGGQRPGRAAEQRA